MVICRSCEQQHPTNHPMLRLPKQIETGRHRAALAAHNLLISTKAWKQQRRIEKMEEKQLKKIKKMRKLDVERLRESGEIMAKSDIKEKLLAECINSDVVFCGQNTVNVKW